MKLFVSVILSILTLCSFASMDKVSSPLLHEAQAKAKKEHKLVYVMFNSSWSAPCVSMHSVIDQAPVKAIWDKYFVTAGITVDEQNDKAKLNTPGGDDLREQLKAKDAGIPFFVFLQDDGTVVANAFMHDGKDNMGCPATPEEVTAFDILIVKVVPQLTASERAILHSAFVNAAVSHG
jgi:hypothetical protein